MKSVVLFLIFLIAACSVFGQSVERPFIEVRGMAKIERTIKTYILDIVITEDLAYTEEKRTGEEVKKAFFNKAKAAGFEATRFKEDKLTYALTQYGAGGSLYSIETTNPEEVIKLNQLITDKTGTLSIIARRVTYLPVSDFSKIIAVAFADGKARAEKMAAVLGKKLGSLQSAIDYTTTNETEEDTVYYQPKEDKYYYISLKYLVE